MVGVEGTAEDSERTDLKRSMKGRTETYLVEEVRERADTKEASESTGLEGSLSINDIHL